MSEASTTPGAVPEHPPSQPRVLTERNFALLFIAQLIANFGHAFVNLAMLWLVKELTGSAAMMGIVAVCMFLPMVLLGPFSGVIVDRFDKRRVMIASDLFAAAVLTVLITVYYTGALRPWHLLVLAASLSTAGSLFNPAKQSIVVHLVRKEALTQANAYLQATFQISQTLGPVLAGFAVASFGAGPAFVLDAAGYVVSALLLTGIRVATTPTADPGPKESVIGELMEGLRAVRGVAILMAILPLVVLVNLLFAPIQVLLPLFVDEITDLGARGLGILESSIGTGMIAGSLFLGAFGSRLRKGGLVIAGFLLLGLAYSTFSLSGSLVLATLAFGVLGLATELINIPAMTLVQETVPAERQGRVFALIFAASMAANPLGSGAAGMIGEAFGVRQVLVAAGGLTLLAGIVVARLRVLREAE